MADQPTREEAQALYEQMTNADLQAELGDRQLAKTGTKPELVARLLDADFPPSSDEGTPAAAEAPPEEDAPADGELCSVCWPDGWPGNDSAASCEHGTWTRWESQA